MQKIKTALACLKGGAVPNSLEVVAEAWKKYTGDESDVRFALDEGSDKPDARQGYADVLAAGILTKNDQVMIDV